MKRLVLICTAAALVVAVCSVGTSGATPVMIELCHAPGTPNEATLSVPVNAVGSHIAHGDLLGPCGEPPPPPPPSPTLDAVLTRTWLRCGVHGSIVGFSTDNTGTWEGLEVDLCRAVAAAVLGDASRVEFVELAISDRFTAVRDGVVDVVFEVATNTLTRDAVVEHGGHGVNFGPTYFYDGGSIMAWPVPLGDCVADDDCSFEDLDELNICVTEFTTTHPGLIELLDRMDSSAVVWIFPLFEDAMAAFSAGDCDAIAADRSALASVKATSPHPDASTWVIFADTFTKEPLAPVVRDGDDEWMAIVRWTVYATFLAEEMGITQADGTGVGAGLLGERLGLDDDWDLLIISQVGNYAEMYNHNLAPLGLDRGQNALYLDGGLLYAPQFR